ncbi:MAG: MFS transporter [Clostridia bacterium]|nr:MFS transporter [Clostridia bacterium]
MARLRHFITEVKTHWNTPDTAHGKYVSGKEYLYVFLGVAANYAAQAPFKYIGFAASCYLIMYHYELPYLSFSVIALIGLPLSYLWNLLDWFVTDNLGILPKRSERRMNFLYLSVAAVGVLLLVFDASALFPEGSRLITAMNGLSGINARAFFKVFGVQLAVNGWGGVRSIFLRKKLIPKHGRYKFSLYGNVIQKSVMIVLLGWLPAYQIPDVYERLWIAYLLFSLFSMFDFGNKLETCSETISPNSEERIFMRAYPIKICHLLNSLIGVLVPMLGSFDDINFYRFVLPGVFLPCAALTMVFAGKIKERIPQPPLQKKQSIPFWYGIFQVMRNKYRWLNMFSNLLDTLGNGMLDITVVIMLYTMRLSGAEYSALMALLMFRTTVPTFFAPWFMKRFSFKQLRIFREVIESLHCAICILALLFLGGNIRICGIVMYISYWMRDFFGEIPKVVERDMNIRLFDYQMYLSGERLEGFTNIFNWFVSPIGTIVGLIIPLLILRSGFNANWNILFFDPSRFGIIAVPLAFDLVGHLLMLIPYFFWDYNGQRHEYVISVLKQRADLAEAGYYPAEYDGSLHFSAPGKTRGQVPTDPPADRVQAEAKST